MFYRTESGFVVPRLPSQRFLFGIVIRFGPEFSNVFAEFMAEYNRVFEEDKCVPPGFKTRPSCAIAPLRSGQSINTIVEVI